MNKINSRKEVKLKGLALSGGRALARVCLFSESRHNNLPKYNVAGEGIEKEVTRLSKALEIAAKRLDVIRAQVRKGVGKAEAEIFVAQAMMARDEKLRNDITALIQKQGLNAAEAVTLVLDRHETQLAALDNAYLRERASDVGEVKRRILDVLADTNPSLECENEQHCQRGRNRIVVAVELTQSLTVDLDAKHLMGFVTEHGGVNSHAAILARALGIPAVSGLKGIRGSVTCGTEILVDGDSGEVVIWPSEKTVAASPAARSGNLRLPPAIEAVAGFEVLANIGGASDIRQALDMKAEGIGLYRTELELIAAGRMLSEKELAGRYTKVVRALKGQKVVFRLFDIGSDKPLPFVETPKEDNPALGLRGARFLLAQPELFKTQARALARASVHGAIHVMYPMITGVDQFVELKNIFMKNIAGLPAGKIHHGIMLEVPSACYQAEELLKAADFASIGSNDLTQYFFAVDRNNEFVAGDFNPDQPVFWKLLRSLVAAAKKTGKPISLCGELAGDARFVPRLITIGVKSVSVSPRSISGIRQTAAAYLAAPALKS